MPNQESAGFARGQRIQDYCKVIWGDGCYDIEVDTEDDYYYGHIRKEFDDHYGPMLLDSGRCDSMDEACDVLERMLADECKSREGE